MVNDYHQLLNFCHQVGVFSVILSIVKNPENMLIDDWILHFTQDDIRPYDV